MAEIRPPVVTRIPAQRTVFDRSTAYRHTVLRDSVPQLAAWTWIPPDIAAELNGCIADPDERGLQFYAAGLELKWTQEIGARTADPTDAAALAVPEGTALVEEWRTGRDHATGRVLEVTLVLSNPAQYRLVFP